MSNYSQNTFNLENKNTSWTKIYNYVPKGSMVLDVGCSSGTLGKELISRKHCTVYGTEVDEGDYKKAKKVLDKTFLVNLETEPMPDEIAAKKFDAIIFADVLEHLVNPAATLQKIRPLLTKNGKVIFSIPNMAHVSVRLQLLAGSFSHGETGLLDKTHLHFYDFDEVKKLFRTAGLNIDRLDANILTYPRSFLSDKLKELRLRDSGFINRMMTDKRAQTFQFVGYATMGSKTGKPELNTTTPDYELVEYIDGLNRQVKSLKVHEQEWQASAKNYEEQLAKIKTSATWKVGRALVKPASKIIKRGRSRGGKK